MRVLLALSLLLFGPQIIAQHQISGAIKGQRGLPIIGANVYIVGTYDGATSNSEGKFSFSTSVSKYINSSFSSCIKSNYNRSLT